MAWRRSGDKPLSEPMMVQFIDKYASLGLNEFMDFSGLFTLILVSTLYIFRGISLLYIITTPPIEFQWHVSPLLARRKSIYNANRPFLNSVAAIIACNCIHAGLALWYINIPWPLRATWEGSRSVCCTKTKTRKWHYTIAHCRTKIRMCMNDMMKVLCIYFCWKSPNSKHLYHHETYHGCN